MSNNDLWCDRCKSHHHPVDCPMDYARFFLSAKGKTGEERKSMTKAEAIEELKGMLNAEQDNIEMTASKLCSKMPPKGTVAGYFSSDINRRQKALFMAILHLQDAERREFVAEWAKKGVTV